jgi:hypothetical protein
MARRTAVFLALLAVVAVSAFIGGTDASGIKLKTPRDLEDRVTDACNSTCVKSCNATWSEYAKWFKNLDEDATEECDKCAVTYYAQDFNVEINDCSCKTLEQFRKLSRDEDIVPDEECAECCLEWALDAISYDEDCKDPSEMRPKDQDKDDKGSYRNMCGFTIKPDEDYEEEKEDKKEEEEKKEKEEEEEKKEDEDEKDANVGVYDYESLGSQFDTCKCICKGLSPCPAPKDSEEEEEDEEGSSSTTASSFFSSAAFAGAEDMGSDSASMDEALSSILP